MGIELELYIYGLAGRCGGIPPIPDCIHGSLTQIRTSAEQRSALHCPVGSNNDLDAHYSSDVKPLQRERIYGLDAADYLSFCSFLFCHSFVGAWVASLGGERKRTGKCEQHKRA
jgi:hypothetical protein